MDRKALVGLLSGVSLVIATLIAVALLNMPEPANAARSGSVVACSVTKATIDRGYGVASAEAGCPVGR